MVVNKRKKSSRGLGSCTHGWGKNKHRNSGSRGGFGNAGTGKKSHNKKPSIWALDYFGKHGFVSKGTRKLITINLREVDDQLPSWIERKLAVVEGGVVVVDLKKVGYDKLLSSGQIRRKLKVVVSSAAKGVAEKVKAAGGELVVSKK
ncbi:uL15 family ribosomal protein [Candidatus Woesearchaeota archaeon]|nr:uL15 family ribosomal protein [Candidatus Woesearchaeota archaeon]